MTATLMMAISAKGDAMVVLQIKDTTLEWPIDRRLFPQLV